MPLTTEQEPSDTKTITYRGMCLIPHERGFRLIHDALIICHSGKIHQIIPAKNSTIPTTHPDCIWIPGLVDAHLHFPQTRITGSASGPLLPWLNESVFPEEARFSDKKYAQAVAKEFCDSLIQAGTTTAFIYSSAHPQATDALFEELDRRGIRGYAGMTLMNRNAPENVLLPTEKARLASIQLIEKWHNHDNGRLQYVVTPRFAISCTSDMLVMASKLSQDYDLWVQTHLSENQDEIDFTLSLFPQSVSYTSLYKDFGLLHNKTIFAHCIHMKASEISLLKEADAVVAHCPDSNFFLGSGGMSLSVMHEQNIEIMLGSDIGAGRSFSIPMTAGRAYDNALISKSPVTPEELLYHSCVSPRKRLRIMNEADFSVFQIDQKQTKKEIIDALLFRHDKVKATATYVCGKKI